MLKVEDINLTDWEFWRRPHEYRHEAFKALRWHSELVHFEEPDIITRRGARYYALTRHADIIEASRRPQDFCSGKGAISIPDMPGDMHEYFGSMISMDDPRHAKIRRIVSRAFSPRMIQRFEDQVEAVAGQIVENVAVGGGTGDFVADVAARLPLRIICDMMGIGEEHYQTVLDATNVILARTTPSSSRPTTPRTWPWRCSAPTRRSRASSRTSARQRRKDPTDDLTSALVNANVDGESLSDQELGSFFILLVVVSNETTRNAIAHGLDLFTRNPDQRALLTADFDGRIAGAIEEIVRYVSPVIWMRRTATRDTTLNEHEIKEGDKLVLYYWSANRDESVFTDADKFDILRDPNPHVGFGGPGPHFCLGAHLARREITVMFRELLRRTPNIRASAEPDRLESNFINGIKRLPYTF